MDVARERQIQKLMKQLKDGSHQNDGTNDVRPARADSSARTDGQDTHNSQTELQRTAIR